LLPFSLENQNIIKIAFLPWSLEWHGLLLSTWALRTLGKLLKVESWIKEKNYWIKLMNVSEEISLKWTMSSPEFGLKLKLTAKLNNYIMKDIVYLSGKKVYLDICIPMKKRLNLKLALIWEKKLIQKTKLLNENSYN